MKVASMNPTRVLKYQLFNGLGAVLNFSALTLLHAYWQKSLIWSAFWAIEIALIHNFFWHYFFTWGDRVLHKIADFFRRLIRFNVLNLFIDSVLVLGGLWLFSIYFSVHYLLADWGGMLASSALKLLANERFVFQIRKQDNCGA